MRVFLGGTCNNSEWRDEIIKYLNDAGIDYFNPVVEDWDEEAQTNELRERAVCDLCLYAITPKMSGVYAVAEVIDDSNKRPHKTVMVLLDEDGGDTFTDNQLKSLKSVAKLVLQNSGKVFYDLRSAVAAIK